MKWPSGLSLCERSGSTPTENNLFSRYEDVFLHSLLWKNLLKGPAQLTCGTARAVGGEW